MANKGGRITGQKNIAARIRGGFQTALNTLKTNGMPIDKLIEKSLKDDFTGTIRALSLYMPKEVQISGKDGGAIEITELSREERINRLGGLFRSDTATGIRLITDEGDADMDTITGPTDTSV